MPGDVIEEGERPGAMDQDVVNRVVDQVLADGVVATGLHRDEHLGADAVGAHHQHRRAHAAGNADHPSERPDLTHRVSGSRARHQPTNLLLGGLGAREIHARSGVQRLESRHALGFGDVREIDEVPDALLDINRGESVESLHVEPGDRERPHRRSVNHCAAEVLGVH